MRKLLSKEEGAFLAEPFLLLLVERELDVIRSDLAGFFRGVRIDVDGYFLPAMVSKCNLPNEVELRCITHGGG